MPWKSKGEKAEAADRAGARLARQATVEVAGLLGKRDMSRADLARLMGVSPGRVSQILSGDENLTLRSLAAVAEALELDVKISFVEPKDDGPRRAHGLGDGSDAFVFVP
ncbi:helix-turn-helix domain-containing protein [Streptomyces malaysiensis]|uniref:Helix-turn-helix domain-containing protein n=1 Tax=Streptomyces malaysiensis subsp. samsunensis TaxID=459658 RepID=A0A9X2RTY1_STRMQ|nr:helix-turn-helix transcriptional regulator [Streptomyces samsunensis]MCQ8830697.1 helix-turn-helix domain-containing protein [Streptomyces samsunensis]